MRCDVIKCVNNSEGYCAVSSYVEIDKNGLCTELMLPYEDNEANLDVQIAQYSDSDKKNKMYEAAKKFYAALESCTSKEEIENLQKEMAVLEAEYSDNPAYTALIKLEYATKKLKVDGHIK